MKNSLFDKHKDTHKNGKTFFIISGGLTINETNSAASSVMLEILTQMGKKVIQGNFIDLLKMSRPAKISSPLTHLICFSNDYIYTELMIKASAETNPIERIKYISAFLLAGLHTNPIICRSKAPLNPILGETFQAFKEDGCQLYLEQTSHHPPTSNYYLIGPNKSFEMFGYGIVNSCLTGANSIKGWREGKATIKFKDGGMYTFTTPDARVSGLVMGDRVLNYGGALIVEDLLNKVQSVCRFPFKEKGHLESLKSIFSSKTKDILDEFTIEILQFDTQMKKSEVVCEGNASWLGQIYFNGQKFWCINEPQTPWKQDEASILKSDSTKRPDLICIQENTFDKAQIHKDELENVQRNDKKIRSIKK